MENRCPKCSKKLSFFYIKQECPECGCDLLYYDMENRLERDAEQAEEEFRRLDEILGRIKSILPKKKK